MGIGSRFGGGVKQLTPVDNKDHLIIDYSIHDAIDAGFNKIVFIIRNDIENDFRDRIGNRIEEICKPLDIGVAYAFQETFILPQLPDDIKEKCEGRTKPWGTGHAILCAADVIDSSFAVINADDYYGKNAFEKAASFIDTEQYGLVGYSLKNTLSDNGGVTRGICSVEKDKLVGIDETKNIVKTADGAEANGKKLNLESLVSMNFWCYPVEFIEVLKKGFPVFLENMIDAGKDEYLLSIIADEMLKSGTEFSVLPTDDRWFGVTYKEDRPAVEESFRNLIEAGVYREDLYSDIMK